MRTTSTPRGATGREYRGHPPTGIVAICDQRHQAPQPFAATSSHSKHVTVFDYSTSLGRLMSSAHGTRAGFTGAPSKHRKLPPLRETDVMKRDGWMEGEGGGNEAHRRETFTLRAARVNRKLDEHRTTTRNFQDTRTNQGMSIWNKGGHQGNGASKLDS